MVRMNGEVGLWSYFVPWKEWRCDSFKYVLLCLCVTLLFSQNTQLLFLEVLQKKMNFGKAGFFIMNELYKYLHPYLASETLLSVTNGNRRYNIR